MNRIITYAINREDDIVWSRVGDEVAVPVLQYEKLWQDGDFTKPFEYELEKFSVSTIVGYDWRSLQWTKKIPTELKNRHRAFWGFPPLKDNSDAHTRTRTGTRRRAR
jgi:hypothetical protein